MLNAWDWTVTIQTPPVLSLGLITKHLSLCSVTRSLPAALTTGSMLGWMLFGLAPITSYLVAAIQAVSAAGTE